MGKVGTMPINFRKSPFKGSLTELVEELAMHWLPSANRAKGFHDWLAHQWSLTGNLFPIRKHKGHSQRGDVYRDGGRDFCPIDNELVVFFF